MNIIIRFTVKRKSRSGTVAIRAAFGIAIQSSLHQQAALDRGIKIVIGYVELLLSLAGEENGSGLCHL